ncbi:PX domain-containing protein kinase-like protein isoform X1 [Halyomorpha halys]|uniref:PX domain-containing protein kinase-like protein isoform X1 n=1 Tax=Halyomorpha halys TaxID=286706 RepID=UPI0006D516F5|nr:PX domain-containing protein kinase-like protein isoform X1 [Halyomorpha halys]
MSVFEQNIMTKIYVDDTDVLLANVINSEYIDGHTEYIIRVQKEHCPEGKWYVKRRYNDFHALHQAIQASGLPLDFPPKKYIGNLNQKFIFERQTALQVYLDEVMIIPILALSFELKKFLDPFNYKNNNRESVLSELRVCVRSDVEIKFVKQLPQLGWRFRKQSFIVSFKNIPKKEYVLHWIPFGPDKYLDDEILWSVIKSYTSLQHVNFVKIEKAGICRGGGWVIQDIKGETLKDKLFEVKDPLNTSALKKYANDSKKKTLSVGEVIEISSQILQAIAFLHHKGIPYGHLHLGNILLDGNSVKLFGIENALFGLPCYYRRYIINCRCIDSLKSVDVYCFGLTMYEMLFVKPFSKDIPENCLPDLKHVMETILIPKVAKNSLPTIKDLLNLPVFRRTPPNPQPYFKISQNVLEKLSVTSDSTMARLKLDNDKAREIKKAKTVLRLLTEKVDVLPSLPIPQT